MRDRKPLHERKSTTWQGKRYEKLIRRGHSHESRSVKRMRRHNIWWTLGRKVGYGVVSGITSASE